ncbi:MAG: DUF3052 domain-containing protein [Acidobacteria bacterium]|nr:DUF3052 domain-containing protein [Acidobacteriota bacterium]
MAGYSGTPLPKKLGIKESHRIAFINAPVNFTLEMGELSPGVEIVKQLRAPLDLIVCFVKSEKELITRFEKLASKLAPAGMLWIAWPKKASGVPTDLTDNIVRRVGLEAGLVDNKVCAIDEVWSGLRFVIRLKDRKL